MSCDCCCKKILRLCKVPVCGEGLNFGITAQVDGNHRMTFDFLGVEFTINKTFVLDDPIIFPVNDLNENYTFTAKLYDPTGKQILIEKNAVEYDCFEFETVMSYAVNEPEPIEETQFVNIIQDIIVLILLSTIPAAISYFLDFCLGHPMSDKVHMKAIFFPYALFLAYRRLKINRRLMEVNNMFSGLLNTEDKNEFREAKKRMNLTILQMGREYFTWEQAVGMCIFCTNFWIALVAATIIYFTIPLSFINSFFVFLTIPFFSHSILRKL